MHGTPPPAARGLVHISSIPDDLFVLVALHLCGRGALRLYQVSKMIRAMLRTVANDLANIRVGYTFLNGSAEGLTLHDRTFSWCVRANPAVVHRRSSVSGTTVLMHACEHGSAACLRALLDKGAEVDVANNKGATALMFACKNGHEACARALLDKGAEVDVADSNGFTALMYACLNGQEACARALLDKGAKVDVANSEGLTVLMLACLHDHEACVRVLLEAATGTHGDARGCKRKRDARGRAGLQAQKGRTQQEEWPARGEGRKCGRGE